MNKKIKKNKNLIIIIIIGLILRLSFILFGAEVYFNRENIFIDGDTFAWQNCIENLLNYGTFTVGGDKGQFSRMPGYAFFMGIFYLFSGRDWVVATSAIGWFQTFLDVFTIYLFYKISIRLFSEKKIALISALLYATYPFIIVWNPVAYAEQLSIFLMLTSLYYFMKGLTESKYILSFMFCGIFLGLSALTRPQILPLIGVFSFVLIIFNYKNKKQLVNKIFLLSFSFITIFGLWPLRNYLNHEKVILTKNAEGFLNWQEDVISFMQFTYAVKPEWDPQYTSIIKNKKTIYPKIAYGNSKNDSLKLEKAIYLAKNCGAGFSWKKGYWKNRISTNEENCNKEISKLFNELRESQINQNPLNFYLIVPLKNLKKSIFKTKLYDSSSFVKKGASLLFYLRTLLILLGLTGVIIMLKNNIYSISIISLLLFISIYFTLCFGTTPFMRNIEIRYFLPADILLLFPTSFLLGKITLNYSSKIKYL